MFFPELEATGRDHPGLLRVAELMDARLSEITSPAPLRPNDFACALAADENQVVSVFELLEKAAVVKSEKMVECNRCQNLMSAHGLAQAAADEDSFECSHCARPFHRRSRHLVIYRMTPGAVSRTKAAAKQASAQPKIVLETPVSGEPLSERAQYVLQAMLELDAVDSDRRKSTEVIAVKAFGTGTDPNSLKSVMAELKHRELIRSKMGRGGGCWLTDSGLRRAQKLRNRLETPQPFRHHLRTD